MKVYSAVDWAGDYWFRGGSVTSGCRKPEISIIFALTAINVVFFSVQSSVRFGGSGGN